jgi:hypothetical protein
MKRGAFAGLVVLSTLLAAGCSPGVQESEVVVAAEAKKPPPQADRSLSTSEACTLIERYFLDIDDSVARASDALDRPDNAWALYLTVIGVIKADAQDLAKIDVADDALREQIESYSSALVEFADLNLESTDIWDIDLDALELVNEEIRLQRMRVERTCL